MEKMTVLTLCSYELVELPPCRLVTHTSVQQIQPSCSTCAIYIRVL